MNYQVLRGLYHLKCLPVTGGGQLRWPCEGPGSEGFRLSFGLVKEIVVAADHGGGGRPLATWISLLAREVRWTMAKGRPKAATVGGHLFHGPPLSSRL